VKRGDQASVSDAPLLVVAPHSTYLDWLAVGHAKASPVAKSELSEKTFFGAIGRLMQTVWVDREAEDSKKETAKMISKRSSEDGWLQTLIFPEGTNTNGKAFIQFRTGAFSTSKPVQPVVLSFPNAVDTLTWGWIQRFKPHHLLFFTLITPITFIKMEFLPVLAPTKEEEEDPRVFADRVRSDMSEHLGIPIVNVSFKDAVAAKKCFKSEAFNSGDPKFLDLENSKSASTSSIDFVGNLTLGI
jgi:1-acyl-sn-glycerol-3-phosphate acyltransferase